MSFKTIKYFKAEELKKVSTDKSLIQSILDSSSEGDNIAVLISVNSPAKMEKAVNITKDGFSKVRELTV